MIRTILLALLSALTVFTVIQGWGLGAILVAVSFASLYAPRAADWLNS